MGEGYKEVLMFGLKFWSAVVVMLSGVFVFLGAIAMLWFILPLFPLAKPLGCARTVG